MSEKVMRSIYYYDLFSLIKENDEFKRDKSHKYINTFFKMMYENQAHVENYSDFVVTAQQGEVFLIIDNVRDSDYYFRIVLCRENALPYIEREGKLESLSTYIGKDQNLAEVTHCVYYGDFGVLGMEFNYNGPRHSLLPEYISKYDQEAPIIHCNYKLDASVIEKISDGNDFTLFEFQVETNSNAYAEMLASKPVFSALQASAPESDTMQIVLKKKRRKSENYVGFSIPFTIKEIKDLLESYKDSIKRFKVSQGTFSNSIDLLSDKFVNKVTVVKTEDRTINSQEMYREINDYFVLHVKDCCVKRSA